MDIGDGGGWCGYGTALAFKWSVRLSAGWWGALSHLVALVSAEWYSRDARLRPCGQCIFTGEGDVLMGA